MAEEDMDFTRAPKSNLETWDGVKRLVLNGTIGVVIVLLLMAFFLLG